MAMLPKLLEQDRKQAGWSAGQAAWRLRREHPRIPGARGTLLTTKDRDRCSDGEAEDHCHHEDERRHPYEKDALSGFGSEPVQHVSFALNFSFSFHCISDTPKGDVGI